ncbi:MAG: hypothetical protein H3C48_18255 [Chitinophagaceae bacterium]|nr:hypothetical protein [Chitinophagaceae bacterium]
METLKNLTSVQLHGIYLLLLGLTIRLIIGSRRYRRKGAGGLQHFGVHYFLALIITAIESLLNIAGLLAILIGLLLIIA